MAKTVLDSYSTELAQVQPPLYSPLKSNEVHGRVRMAFFTKVFGTEAAGEDVGLCVLPKGARILGGEMCVSATTGSATIAIGLKGKDETGFIDAAGTVSDGVALLKAAAAHTTTAKAELAATIALYYGYETQKELIVTATTAADAMAAQTLKGHVLYVVD